MSQEEGDVDGVNPDVQARLVDLIIFSDQARRRIAELESTVENLEQKLSELRRNDTHPAATLRRKLSAPLIDQPFKENGLQHICNWNEQLVDTVNALRGAMLNMETEAKVQIVVLKDEVERLRRESDSLRRENDALKERVADDVLRQRQTNRVEMAVEKAKIASRVRAAGLRRLEFMEAVLMEAHDDLYFTQRFDAAKLPVRDVTFVIHAVSNVSSQHLGGEEFTMAIYQNVLLEAAKKYSGYHVCGLRGIEVFAFYSATAALHFSSECHVGVKNLPWPARTTDIPFFAPVIDDGELLYSGPRMHTCMYTCNPGSEVDPINGRSVYYGQEVKDALTTALQGAPIGEIVANKACVIMLFKEANIMNDVHDDVSLEVSRVRAKLGAGWNIVASERNIGNLFFSILPKSLERRRGIPPYYLHPSPRFPRGNIDVDTLLPQLIASMKGVTRPCQGGTQQKPQAQLQIQLHSQQQQQQYHEGWVDGIYRSRQRAAEKRDSNPEDVVSLYSLRRDRKAIMILYNKLEAVSAFHEQTLMESEDWYLARLQSIDPSETFYLCTLDVGSNASWRKITQASMGLEEHHQLRQQMFSSALLHGKNNFGVYVNGNNADVFTFAFRRPEHVLRFTAQMYTVVKKNCEAFTKSETCLLRAGITVGKLRLSNDNPTAITNTSSGTATYCKATRMVLCRGKALVCSGHLCDLACRGEILAVADVIQAFQSNKSNLLSMEYNVLKKGGRFLGSYSTLVDVYSILPKAYAYRRQLLKSGDDGSCRDECETSRPSVKAALQLGRRFMSREEVEQLLVQQRQLLERAEAAMMAAEDNAWDITTQQALILPWPVVNRSGDRSTTAEMSFLYCDAVEIVTLSRAVPEELYKNIMGQYNYVVKEALLAYDGFIAKTDSTAAYIVMFTRPDRALEAALQIQRRLLAVDWPQRIKTLEATLYVKSSKTNIVLFDGIRARMAVHVSNDYQSTKMFCGEDGELVEVFGPAIETVAELGLHACGGEIIVTPFALSRIGSNLHGSMLLLQVAMQVARTHSSNKTLLASCVPRRLWERLHLFVPAAPVAEVAKQGTGSKLRQSKVPERKRSWWRDGNNFLLSLPLSSQAPWGARVSASHSAFASSVQASLGGAVGQIRRELSSSIGFSTHREVFLNIAGDLLMNLSHLCRMVGDGVSKANSLSPLPPIETGGAAAISLDASTNNFRQTLSPDHRSSGILNKKLMHSSNSFSLPSVLTSSDPHKNALQMLDNLMREALHRIARALGGTGKTHLASSYNRTSAFKSGSRRGTPKLSGSLRPH
ncbi:hypothetical protein MOQ_002624 [Trypanosoma cruzi marinkellei]|uniref:Adenylyl cyclase n=1 Tax=Trypanosoma cruzi marinkellei TaxID=85056 RepID=K2N1X9_TRYCR|nr:hypothetical protein MOQ_002624 [Trypanosoma cruzi marinkellei]